MRLFNAFVMVGVVALLVSSNVDVSREQSLELAQSIRFSNKCLTSTKWCTLSDPQPVGTSCWCGNEAGTVKD